MQHVQHRCAQHNASHWHFAYPNFLCLPSCKSYRGLVSIPQSHAFQRLAVCFDHQPVSLVFGTLAGWYSEKCFEKLDGCAWNYRAVCRSSRHLSSKGHQFRVPQVMHYSNFLFDYFLLSLRQLYADAPTFLMAHWRQNWSRGLFCWNWQPTWRALSCCVRKKTQVILAWIPKQKSTMYEDCPTNVHCKSRGNLWRMYVDGC